MSTDPTPTRPWPDPPELTAAAPLFRLGYRQAQTDAITEIERLRGLVRHYADQAGVGPDELPVYDPRTGNPAGFISVPLDIVEAARRVEAWMQERGCDQLAGLKLR